MMSLVEAGPFSVAGMRARDRRRGQNGCLQASTSSPN